MNFLDILRDLLRQPKHALDLIIDILDECGDNQTRPARLKVPTDAAACSKLLSRVDPKSISNASFGAPTRLSHLRHNIVTDQEATGDLQTLAQRQFDLVAEKRCLPGEIE